MRTLVKLVLAFAFLFPLIAVGQQVTIKGRIIDANTLEVVPFANVFIVNTSVGTATDTDGNFVLTSDNLGDVDIIVSFVGYDNFKKHVGYSEAPIDLGTIRLKPSETVLDEVVVKGSRDKQWEKDLKKFKAVFLGKDLFAEECVIQNPWVIDIKNDDETHTMSAKSLAPIVVFNNAMGYMLKFSLRRLASNPEGFTIEGDTYFLELAPPTPKDGERWIQNRDVVYRGSSTNLFRSIVNHNLNGQGFVLYADLPGNAGSLTRMSRFNDNVGKKIALLDTTNLVTRQPGSDRYVISLKGRIEVHNKKEKTRQLVYQDVNYPVSWITLKSNSVVVNENGVPSDPLAVIVSGEMSNDRVSRMLPLDYKPKEDPKVKRQKVVRETLPLVYEQIYMHTDRPYYYGGEHLWFKGYLDYSTADFRDSLSNTVYIDLITPDKTILISKVLKVDSGRFMGGIDLPVAIDKGTYNLRAYTNLERNFGDSTLYVKPIPILDLRDMVEKIPVEIITSDAITISTSKEQYKPREKIEMTVKLFNAEGHPIGGDLSVTVTDAKQVSPVTLSPNIEQSYLIKRVPAVDPKASLLPFVVEHGITIKGRFTDDAGKPLKASLNIIQLNPKDLATAESDENGYFTVNHFEIYDSSRFSITATDKKGKSFGKAVILGSDKPQIFYKELASPLKIETGTTVQRDPGYEKTNDTRLLEEVEIRGERVKEEFLPEYRMKRSYGEPDRVLRGDELSIGYSDLLLALQGRFPGLIIRQVSNQNQAVRWAVYLAKNGAGSFVIGPQEVLVTVDDAIMSGTPESVLAMIHPNQVESVELRSRTNVLYGNVSNGGILSIYLKKGVNLKNARDRTPVIGTVKATGYTFVSNFSGPNYDEEKFDLPDNRSLIHWSPVISIKDNGVATTSFFSADLPTTYRIEVEGITKDGKPVRAVTTVAVK